MPYRIGARGVISGNDNNDNKKKSSIHSRKGGSAECCVFHNVRHDDGAFFFLYDFTVSFLYLYEKIERLFVCLCFDRTLYGIKREAVGLCIRSGFYFIFSDHLHLTYVG